MPEQPKHQTAHEPLTSDLLAELLEASSPEAYLSQAPLVEGGLSTYLAQLLEAKQLKRAEVIRRSGLNTTYAYQIFSGDRIPGRDHALMLAFGLGCDLTETQRLLRHANAAELWCKKKRDAILIFCIEHGYTRSATDDELYRLDEKTLLMERT